MAHFRPKQVHFVGSVCLPDTDAVFKRLSDSFPASVLQTIPDGEVGKRGRFVVFQLEVFADMPFVIQEVNEDASARKAAVVPGGPDAPPIRLRPLQYDEFAVESYRRFAALRESGAIARGVRFQVSLPTPANVLGNLVTADWRAALERPYVDMLLACLARIQEAIPAEDLAVQWDLASEVAYLELVHTSAPWFPAPHRDGLVARLRELVAAVRPDVPVGFHICYGDYNHQHFCQPKDLRVAVEFANDIVKAADRHVAWVHMPVPRDRSDEAYFAPLTDLKIGDSKLFLGLIHQDDLAGTEAKIEMASKFWPEFGVATECGLGRADTHELDSIISIAQKVTSESS